MLTLAGIEFMDTALIDTSGKLTEAKFHGLDRDVALEALDYFQ